MNETNPELEARAVKKNDIWDQLEEAAAKLITVTVATVITQVSVTFKDGGQLDTVTNPESQITDAIITNVNLIDGDLTTIIAPSLKDDQALRTFHERLVTRAITVLPDNLKALAGAVEKIFGKRNANP